MVDFTKPIRRKRHPDQKIRYLTHRKTDDNNYAPVVYALEGTDGIEHIYLGQEEEFENLPESRFVNIYQSIIGGSATYPSLDAAQQHRLEGVLGTLEYRPDGSSRFHPKKEMK